MIELRWYLSKFYRVCIDVTFSLTYDFVTKERGMSDITYVMIQLVVLVCYASWVFYNVGYQKGRTANENETDI